jgi:hypothetical protein
MRMTVFFLFVFFSVFGMKIGFVDFAVVAPIVLLPLLAREGRTSIYHWTNKIYFGLLLLSIILSCSQIINDNFILYDNLRFVRAFLAVVLITLALNGESAQDILKVLFYVLLSHCVILIVSANIFELNALTSILSGNERFRHGRSSGLLAGYDIAGILSLFALAMIAFDVIYIRPFLRFLFYGIILSSIFYTSRVSMAFALCITFVWIGRIVLGKQYGMLYKLSFVCLSILSLFVLLRRFLIIIDVTFNLGLHQFYSGDYAESVTSVHAAQKEDSFLWSDMFVLPDTLGGAIWGTGADIISSDVGYIKEIFRYGFVGLAISVAVHYVVVIKPARLLTERNMRFFYYFVFVLIIMLSLKNNYFFTRGVWPVYIIYGLAGLKMAQLRPNYYQSEDVKQ